MDYITIIKKRVCYSPVPNTIFLVADNCGTFLFIAFSSNLESNRNCTTLGWTARFRERLYEFKKGLLFALKLSGLLRTGPTLELIKGTL